ncbi:MAG: hypothetical protein JNM57_14880 [Cyclobacteriaceae bacterium]|nr:hypothetical protein [Cyclobacteriaceae bacterium]
MNNDKKKSIMALSITLIIGVLLGLLIPGAFHKIRQRGERGSRGPHYTLEHKQKWFASTIHRIIQPDSLQAQQIKPVTDWAAIGIDSIERSANLQMSNLLDSVKVQLNPLLSHEQRKRLEEFDTKAKANWNVGEKRRRK